MKKSLLIPLILLLLIAAPALAEPDYSNVKGDFKIFCLGDSPEVTRDKFNYLRKTGGISPVLLSPDNFLVKVAGVSMNCRLIFRNNQLYQIYLETWNGYYAKHYLNSIITDKLKPIFTSLYGEPSNNPDSRRTATKNGYITMAYVWRLAQKKIALGVFESHFKYYGVISIVNQSLANSRTDSDDFVINEEVEKSKNDF